MCNLVIRGRCAGWMAALLVSWVSLPVQADVVTEPLFETTTLVTGKNINLAEFNLSTPGTLLIELKDLQWPALLDILSFSLTDATQTFQKFTANGAATNTWTFDVAVPGTYYGSIFARPSASAQAGLYYANVSYKSISAVPLPAAAWFLISGIAGMVAFIPKQKLSQICA